MTTPDPLDGMMLPFGWKFTAEGGSFRPVYSHASLPDGIHTLQVVWDEPQEIRILRSPQRAWQTQVEIGRIPAGEGRRSLVIPGVVVEGNTFLSIGREGASPEGAIVAVTVITIPLA